MLKVKRKLNAIIAIEIILTMTLYYFIFVGVTAVTYALDIVKTNHENIDFSAYFLDSNGEKVNKIEMATDSGSQYLYVDISVHNEGYFNGSINLENNNFNIKPNKLSTEISEISGNEVKLNQINAGNTVTIKLEVEPNFGTKITEESLTANTNVTLKGQYINSKNVEKEKNIEISGNAEVGISWKSSEGANVELETGLLTNHIYNIQNEDKRVVQLLIKSKMTNNNYPVKSTEINLDVPQDVKNVQVHTRSTKATNNDIAFNENNYTYNQQENKLSIKLNNDDSNNVNWEKDAKDIIVVTYELDENSNYAQNGINIEDKITTYDNKELAANNIVNIENDIDGIVTTDLKSNEESIFKGKIYTGEDRDYTVLSTVNVDFLDGQTISLKQNETSYLKNDQEIAANIIYKQTKIDKNEFLKIFGDEGNITIKNNNETILANINKDSETDENGKIVINYPTEEKSINFETSVPTQKGVLNIENTKTIKSNEYSREEIESFSGIRENVSTNEKITEAVINLKETESKAEIKLDTNKISTLSDKQTITVDAILLANDESKELYKNPNVTIRLPKQLELISAQYAVLYKNGLEAGEAVTSENENKQTEVNINLNGEQLNYDSAGGTTVRLKLDVKTSKLTPTQNTKIEMLYTNENKNVQKEESADLMLESQYGLMLYNNILGYNNKNENVETIDTETVYGSLDVKSSSKDAKLQTALINNYEQEIQNIVLTGDIPTGSDENSFNATLNAVNTNNSNAKIYYTNNKNLAIDDSSWTENSDGAVKYKIIIDKMEPQERLAIETGFNIPSDLKYNVQGDLDTNVTYSVNSVEQKNSSKIVLKTKEGNNADLEKSTDVSDQDNVSLDQNKGATLTNENIKIDVTASVGERVLTENENVKEGETVKYTIKITNNSGHDFSKVNVKAIQKNGYVWDIVEKTTDRHTSSSQYTEVQSKWYEITDKNEIVLGTIPNLKNGESYDFSYKESTYLLNNSGIDGNETYGTIYLESEDSSLNQSAVMIKNGIQSSKIQIDISNPRNEEQLWVEGETAGARMTIKNLGNENVSNINVQLKLSKGFSDIIKVEDFKLSNVLVSLDKDDMAIENDENIVFNKIEKNENGEAIIDFKISNIAANESKNMTIVLYDMDISGDSIDSWILANATTEDNQTCSSKFERTVYGSHSDINVKLSGFKGDEQITSDSKLNDEDTIKLIAEISNNDSKATTVRVNYDLDDALELEDAYIDNEKKEDLYSKFEETSLEIAELEIPAKSSIRLVVSAKIDGTSSEEAENEIQIQDVMNNSTATDKLTFHINPYDEDDDDNTTDDSNNGNNSNNNNDNKNNGDDNKNDSNDDNKNNGTTSKNYKISGTAWVDENEDGSKSTEEKRIAQMQVGAMNTKTNKIVGQTKTDSNGDYTLELPEGEYIIIFYYDNEMYKVTTYKAKGVSESKNSDAIDKEFNLNGQNLTLGATDTINLNKNLSNIDIGLVQKNKFKLNIEKFVSKVVVQNQNGTKTYEQKDNTTLAKAEIKSKYLENSLVVIEYKIKVTNNGDIEGYAKSIEDAIPTSLTFKSSMNSDWYKSGTKLYNDSLANTPIKPGETKELTLVLTKTMTTANTGLINNKAQIIKSANSYGIENESENQGSANVIISVSTGALINYIAVVLGIFAMLGFSAYLLVHFFERR